MKKIIFIILLLLIPSITHGKNILDSLNISVKGKYYNGYELYLTIDNKINKYTKYNLEKKKEIYQKLLKQIHLFYTVTHNKNVNNIEILIKYGLDDVLSELKTNYSKTQKIILGYTKDGKEINAYYRGNPENGYLGIFANIHGGYEYGTYNTALYLKEEFEKSGKTGWFIIPTINPEGLEYYFKYKTRSYFYNKGRVNSNNVDLNRNFCTSNFELKTFIKNGEYFKTGVDKCNSEAETKVVINTLNKYNFKKIISLHSEGNVFYIPDNSIDDKKIIDFGNDIHDIIPNYDFDLSYNTNAQKKYKVFHHEINEGGYGNYTGTMETYIYEKYNIPVILLELKNHGITEYKLKGLVDILPNN